MGWRDTNVKLTKILYPATQINGPITKEVIQCTNTFHFWYYIQLLHMHYNFEAITYILSVKI